MSSYTERSLPNNPTTSLKEVRNLKLTILSAKDLPQPELGLRRMKMYAEVSLSGTKTVRTNVDVDGESNPTWNFPVDYVITRQDLIVVKLFRKRSAVGLGYKCIGEVEICVENLLDSGINSESYNVKGTREGVLNVSYTFGDKFYIPS